MEDYNVTLSLDFNTQLPKGESNDVWLPLVRKIAMLKRNCFACIFEKYFEYQAKPELAKGTNKRAIIQYREDETMYVDASADRVVVIFSTIFKDADDNIIGKVFMDVRIDKENEIHLKFKIIHFSFSFKGFYERRRQFQQAPQIIVNYRTPPDELKDMPNARVGDNIGYLTFGLEKIIFIFFC